MFSVMYYRVQKLINIKDIPLNNDI